MNFRIGKLLCGLVGCWCVAAANSASAQSLTTLASLNAATTGRVPLGALVQGPDGNFYGTTSEIGPNGSGGGIFEITPAGALTAIYGFCAQKGVGSYCLDGDTPSAALTLGVNGNFYGTTAAGGVADSGVIFSFSPPTRPQSITAHSLYDFCVLANCADGGTPTASLLQYTDGSFYGTTTNGGYDPSPSSGGGGQGTVFRFTLGNANAPITLNTVYTWCSAQACADGAGSNPNLYTVPSATPGLAVGGDGNLYGMTAGGGANGNSSAGTVYKISPAAIAGGTNPWTPIYSFCAQAECADGQNPTESLVKGNDGFFYGTTSNGGDYGGGTIFKISTGGALTTIYNFFYCGQPYDYCPSGGGSPTGALIQASNGNFYGVTATGGIGGVGTIFQLTPTGTVTTIYNFCSVQDTQTGYCLDGNSPLAGLVEGPHKKLYGTTSAGGVTNDGTVFRLSVLGGDGADSVAQGAQVDYLGAARASYTVWSPTTGLWYSSNGALNPQIGNTQVPQLGAFSDLPVVGDFDGDGQSDPAVFRPSSGNWYIIPSSTGVEVTKQWGVSTDLPVTGDFDGDGKTDIAVWRPSTGYWYIVQSSNGQVVTKQWGAPTDIPVVGDFDGDGKSDIAVWRPSTGYWYIIQSSNGAEVTKSWGAPTDIPVSGDFDGDGKTDIAVWRPSTGYWYIVQSSNNEVVFRQWGEPTDIPVARDYDGDGKTDIAVFRPSNEIWYVIQSGTGQIVEQPWGVADDVPVDGLTR